MKITCLTVLALLLILSNCSIYDQYYEECRKIADAMTLEQKVGQTLQMDIEGLTSKEVTNPDQAINYSLGSVLISGNAAPTTDGNLAKLGSYFDELKNIELFKNATAANWKKLTDRFKDLGVKITTKQNKQYSIKLLFGTDAVHGDQHSVGSILFPHNIGLSCSHNQGNFENLGYWTRDGVSKSGFNYVFAPCVATSHSPQWGRYYQSMGQESDFIYKYGKSFIKGLQNVSGNKLNGPVGSTKHFFADGATQYGANQGSASVINYRNFIEHNTQGYKGSIEEQVGTVMVSYSAINFVPNSFNSYFLQALLRDELGFRGFTISDYDEVERARQMSLPRTFMNLTEAEGYVMLMNAGVDMIMLSGRETLFQHQVERIIKEAKKAISKSLLMEERIAEAVTRILQVKMAMGLITSGNQQKEQTVQKTVSVPPSTSSGDQYQDSLTAVHQSLVLLKNSNTIPAKGLFSDIKYVVLAGESVININRLDKNTLFRHYDNIGMQNGGWTVRWQGFEGNDFWSGQNKASSNASSILDALHKIQQKNNFTIVYPQYSNSSSTVIIDVERRQFIDSLKNLRKNMTAKNTMILAVIGEVPYAQSQGDVNIRYCQKEDLQDYCLYNPYLNSYVPSSQPRDLTLDFSKFQREIITQIRGEDKSIPLVSVLLTGRPMPIPNVYEESSAVIAAWLPGTSGGQGIMDAITGDYVIRQGGVSNKKNSLSMDWPRSMEDLDNFPVYGSDGKIPQITDIQFKVGFGLSSEVSSRKKSLVTQ